MTIKLPSIRSPLPTFRRTAQDLSDLSRLHTDLLLEILEFTDFYALLALTTTSHHLRLLTFGWVLRHFRATGVCSFGNDVHLQADNYATFKANLATITDVSVFLPLAFRCAADFQPRWKFLQMIVTMLPNLSLFTFDLEKRPQNYPHSVLTWYHRELLGRFWDTRLRKETIVVLCSDECPRVIDFRHSWNYKLPVRCVANASPTRRTSAAVRNGTSIVLSYASARCRKVFSHTRSHSYSTWWGNLRLYHATFNHPSLTLSRVRFPSEHFNILLPGREGLTSFHASSSDLSFLDWGLLLPMLDFPSLSSLYIHHKCRGLTKSILHNFLMRHPTITTLIVMSEEKSFIDAEAFKQCLPNLDTLAGPVHAIIEVLRAIQSPRKLSRIKITNYHGEGLTVHRHKPIDFAALDIALELVATTRVKDLGIGLPGGSSSKDWLTGHSHPFAGNGKFADLETLNFWPYDCRFFDEHYIHWFEEFRRRNFPGIDLEQVNIVMLSRSRGAFPSTPCRIDSGAALRD